MERDSRKARRQSIFDFFQLIDYIPKKPSEESRFISSTKPSFSLENDTTLETVVTLLQPDVVLEFGSWLGRSANSFLRSAPKDTILVAVDTFLGSFEHWLNLSPVKEFSRDELNLEQGRPRLYEQFQENMQILGWQSQVFPFQGTTETFFKTFSSLGISFPLIFVDAAHDYDSVYSDLTYAYRLLPTNATEGGGY